MNDASDDTQDADLPTLNDRVAWLLDIGGRDFLDEIVALFREQTPSLIEAAEKAAASGDLEQVARSVHSLKSSAGNLGARDLYEVCRRAEEHAQAGDGDAARELTAELSPTYEAFLEGLDAHIEALEPAPGSGA